MKRDLDLIRHILLEIESDASPAGLPSEGLEIEGYAQETTKYHIKLLYQAGLLEGVDLSDFDDFKMVNMNLTWEGHEFLENIRKPEIWQQAKNRVMAAAGGASMEMIKFAVADIIKQQLTG